MKTMTLGLVILAALASLAGCATVGREFDTTHANDVKTGAHDKTQVTSWFGAPSATAQLKDHPQGCVERWQWVHATATVGSAAKSKALIVDFDSTGKVCDHAYSVQ